MFNIAIDGPAGAGKSSIAKAVAKNLGFIYVDTGALYRSIALNCLKQGVAAEETEQVVALLENTTVELKFEDGTQKVILNGEDVSEAIRTPEVSANASKVSAIPEVRTFLFDLQQTMAKENNVLMDGRDIGTVVLPNADLKVFLTASPEVRAKRRYDELIAKGQDVDYDTILADVKERDYRDTHRDVAPLKAAEDAVIVDSSDMSFDEVAATIQKLAEERL